LNARPEHGGSRPATDSGASTRQARRLLLVLAILCAAGLLVASLAQARGVVGSFGGAGSGDGEIGSGAGVGVYGTTGDVYISDGMTYRVDRFDADGNFELAFGWGVADGSDEFQICTSGCQAGTPGAAAGQFSENGPRSIAVDQSDGSVYVSDAANMRIQKFDEDGNFLRAFGWGVLDGSAELQACTTVCRAGIGGSGAGQLGEGQFDNPIAVDPTSGNLLMADPSAYRVQEFSPAGEFVRMFGADVDSGGGEGFEVCTVAASCKAGRAGEEVGAFGMLTNIGVDSDGMIYAADTYPPRVQRFTPSGGSLVPSLFPLPGEYPFGLVGPAMAVDPSTDHVVVFNMDSNFITYAIEVDAGGNEVDRYLGVVKASGFTALTFNPAGGRGYAVTSTSVYVIDAVARAEVSIAPATDVSATGATLHGTVNSHGSPAAEYHFEYSLDGATWVSTSTATAPADESQHQVSAQVSPPAGLEPGSSYSFRLVAEKPGSEPVISAEETFTTASTAPVVETVGSPFRTTTTARLDARVNPRGDATTYRFEWGPTTSYGNSAPADGAASAGDGQRSTLVSQQITALEPGSTYHYRVVATNGSGTTTGEDRTVTTRVSDQLSHGHLPGPPGSDRAYEQVSLPESGGNPVIAGYAFSDDGNRAIYQIAGGTPQSDNGTMLNQFFAERTANGWKSSLIWPSRGESTDAIWLQPAATDDLSQAMAENFNPGASTWLMGPGLKAKKLFYSPPEIAGYYHAASEDFSRFIMRMKGSPDPSVPVSGDQNFELYDVTTGTPRLFSFMPDGSVPTCGVPIDGNAFRLPNNYPRRDSHWISADGSRVFFPSSGSRPGCEDNGISLYMRDFDAEETVEVSGSPLSGPNCSPTFIKSTEEAAYFWTQSRLDPADNAPDAEGCAPLALSNGDVYRYVFSSGKRVCLTCGFGEPADVQTDTGNFGAGGRIAVAADDSRIYFSSPRRLVEGEGSVGAANLYRLNLESGEVAFVSPAGSPGDLAINLQAINADGTVITFPAAAAEMNALTGSDNGGFTQYYRYDDRDGSLVCASCPLDGSPAGEIDGTLVGEEQIGPNSTPLDDAGDFIFVTSTPLVGADQNTSKPGEAPVRGNDLYEWRDGRVLLVTSGKTSWDGSFASGPWVAGISPDGRDVFFTVADPLTPDAIDGFKRLYDARIGGGFEFPTPPPPCPLEVCQGEAKGAPVDPVPASTGFRGLGNVTPPKARHRKKCHRQGAKKRCVKKHVKKKGKNQAKRHAHKTGRTH
jgi:NHL repeat